MLKLSLDVLDGREMPDDWPLCVVVPIFKGCVDAMSCGAKVLENTMKIVKRLLDGIIWNDWT